MAEITFHTLGQPKGAGHQINYSSLTPFVSHAGSLAQMATSLLGYCWHILSLCPGEMIIEICHLVCFDTCLSNN
jgi:hypothetical protein